MFTVTLIVPNHKHLHTLATKLGLVDASFEALCENPNVERELLKAVQEQSKKCESNFMIELQLIIIHLCHNLRLYGMNIN